MRTGRIVLLLVVVLLMVLPLPSFTVAQADDALPLAEHGPYSVGRTNLTFTDENREAREFDTVILYPAIIPDAEKETRFGLHKAEPDNSDAPYPLILYSHWWSSNYMGGHALFTHLASQGFVVASIDHKCDSAPTCLIDRPMDIHFVLDHISQVAEENLAAIIDTDHAGVMGISFGGYTTLAAAGGQVDPEYFLDWAVNGGAERRAAPNVWDRYIFDNVLDQWDEVSAYRARFDDVAAGEPWPSITDTRIQAALPMVPSLEMSFGEHGLASVTVPTLILASTADEFVPYKQGTVPLFEQLGADERFLISFIGYGHHPELHALGGAYYKHFATAFFGHYLQENEDYAEYLIEDFVGHFDDLAWGVNEGE